MGNALPVKEQEFDLWEKERTDSYRLSFDLHSYKCPYAQTFTSN